MSRKDRYTRLLYGRRLPLVGSLAYYLLKLLGAEVPRNVPIGEGVTLEHGGFGIVIHPNSKIGDRVKIGNGTIIYPNVTIMHDTVIGKDVIIHAGSVIGRWFWFCESFNRNVSPMFHQLK